MKLNKFYIVLLVLAGACLGFFGLVYWNTYAITKQVRAQELEIDKGISAIIKLLSPQGVTNQDNNQK